MNISTKTDYAVSALSVIARVNSDHPVSILNSGMKLDLV